MDSSGEFRVDTSCEPAKDMLHKNWFVLPPRQAAYYKAKNPTYQELPPLRSDCYGIENLTNVMEMVYPLAQAELYVPIDINGERGEIVFEVVHRSPESQLHWHLDDTYLGSTYNTHEISFSLCPDLMLLL